MRLRFLGAARKDLRAEAAYYRQISPDLGRRFVDAVENTTARILDHPNAMESIEHGIRRWPVDGFPHGVLYQVEVDVILVLAIFHPKQDPVHWRARFASREGQK